MTLHAGASQVPAIASLPERSTAHYLQHLHTARAMMRGNRDNPALQNADREVLDVILGQLDIVEAHWGEIESACATMPRTLVHGDVTGKNLRLRRRGRSQTLVTFDWEMAGSGVPAPDLVLVQAGLYASLVRDTWPDLDAPCIRQMGRIGKLFRGALAPISWASLSLQYAWVEHPMILLRLYEERLRESLRAAGWERTHDDDASPRIMTDGSSRSCRDNGRAGAGACRARSIVL